VYVAARFFPPIGQAGPPVVLNRFVATGRREDNTEPIAPGRPGRLGPELELAERGLYVVDRAPFSRWRRWTISTRRARSLGDDPLQGLVGVGVGVQATGAAQLGEGQRVSAEPLPVASARLTGAKR
jgi:hypothetical protein